MAARKSGRTSRSATPHRMQGASAFENPSTSLFLLSVANGVDHKTLQSLSLKVFSNPQELSLLRVQLDNELLVNRRRLHILALGQSNDPSFELFALLFEPGHGVLALRDVARLEHRSVLVHFFLDGDYLAHRHQIGRDVDLLPVHAHVAVQHKLSRLRTG